MSKKNKNGVRSSDFHDYFEGKLSNRERNAFERKLQKDLFNEEAAEGFTMVSREEAEEDLANASKKIRRRINLRKRVGWYSAAATLAAILTISTIFFAVDRNPDNRDERIREMSKALDNTVVEEPKNTLIEEEKVDVLPGSDEKNDLVAAEETVTPTRTSQKGSDGNDAEDTGGGTEGGGTEYLAETPPGIVENDLGSEAKVIEIAENQEALKEVIPMDADAENEVMEEEYFAMDVADEVLSEVVTIEYMDTEAPVKKEEAIAMEEVQVSAVSTNRAAKSMASQQKAAPTGDLNRVTGAAAAQDDLTPASVQKATPINGMTTYMVYVDSTLVFPVAEYSRNAAAVDLKFYVLPNGRPDNIQIISSPSKAFSDEAQGVITNGPTWIPANSNGEYDDSELEMRIDFKEKHKLLPQN